MQIGFLYWLIWLIVLIIALWLNWGIWHTVGSFALIWVMFLLIGWKVFGPPIRSG